VASGGIDSGGGMDVDDGGREGGGGVGSCEATSEPVTEMSPLPSSCRMAEKFGGPSFGWRWLY
jgi:hypothetical protein